MATGLRKVKLAINPRYKKSGIKSYVFLLHKWGFNPTKEGPYIVSSRIQQTGKYLAQSQHPIGGKARVLNTLLKKTGAGGADVGEVTADDQQNDSLYLAEVSIGTPPQTFKLDFDTGSADLWVWSTQLPSSITSSGANTHSLFDPSESSTFNNMSGSSWKIQYGDHSSASGTVGTDTVSIGGLTIQNQAIELAQELSQGFIQGSGDGLLGLAFGSINTVQPESVATPVENMISQSDIPKTSELFTANLGSWRDANDPDQGESFYTFGYIDDATVQASGQQISYTPIDNSQGFWMFDSASASVNGQDISRDGNKAIADTGTTLALVDDSTCEAIYSAIPGASYDSASQGYIFPTDTTADNLPTVAFAVGGTQFVVNKEDLAFAAAKEGYVYGGIQSRGDSTFDILGDTFLKSIYAIFDQGNMRFGAVQRSEAVQNLAPPPQQ